MGKQARELCVAAQREAIFLDYRPSQIAAASLTFAVKTHFDRKVKRILMHQKGFKFEKYDPLKMWRSGDI